MTGTTRADRITEMIEEKIAKGEKFTTQNTLQMQYDQVDILARPTMQNILKIYKANKATYVKFVTENAEPEAYSTLINFIDENLTEDWDGNMHVNSKIGALYTEYINHFYSMLLQK